MLPSDSPIELPTAPPVRRLKLTIAYDGRPWKGWQAQPGGQTVQDQMEAVLLSMVYERTVIHASGRTDAGVHARGQVAHITVKPSAWTPETWLKALNARLPGSIRILKCEDVPRHFHARYDARGKTYEYRLWRAAVSSPFEAGLSWHPFGKLDLDLLKEAGALFLGRHNFARLSANRGDMTEVERRENSELLYRTIYRVEVIEEGDIIRLEFEGEGFMYRMVRLMVGGMVRVARKKSGIEWLKDLLENPVGEKCQHCAPPEGLYLKEVMYPEMAMAE